MIDRNYKQSYADFFNTILYDTPEGREGRFYESAMPSYIHPNRLMSSFFWKRVEIALRMAEDLTNRTVLDFGSGCGVTFQYLARKKNSITACDKEYYRLAEAAARFFNIPVNVYSDLFMIQGRKFDRIFALDVFEHIENPDIYIEKLAELCKPDGYIILSGPTENRLYKIGRRLAGFSGHYHLRNIFDIEEAFGRKGLQRITVKRLYPFCTLFRISKWSLGKGL